MKTHMRDDASGMLYRGLDTWEDLEVRVKGDEGIVEGIAVPWDRPTRIDSMLTEEFARGAFDAQIRRPSSVFLARGHMPYGGTPIGRLTEMRNDGEGLWVSAKVSRTAVGEETLVLLKDGVLDRFSIGFAEGKNAFRQDAKLGQITRRLTAGLREVAIVPNPAYQEAKVLALRGEACPMCGVTQGERHVQADDALPVEVREAQEALDRAARLALPLPPKAHARAVVGLSAAHKRVVAAKGPASAKRCVTCGGGAAHWAYNHKDPAARKSPEGHAYSDDPKFYEPKCVPCHKAADLRRKG